MHQVTDRVIIVGHKGIRHLYTVVPAGVPVRQPTAVGRVQEVGVDVVLKDLDLH